MNCLFHFKLLVALIVLSIGCPVNAFSQTYLFFQDSPTSLYYDFSWMEVTSPSELQRLGTELRKFPVEEEIEAVQGLNSLRLTWKSAIGGGWVAIAAGLDWTEKNLTQTDSMLFYLYSMEGLSTTNLPLVFMEDVLNRRTTQHSFATYSHDLLPGVWTRIVIPMQLFFDAGDDVDFARIKTIGFSQGAADGQTHTLLVDDMRVYIGSGISPPASVPTGVTATGYDSHIEVLWHANPETDLNGYQVQRSLGIDKPFSTIGLVQPSDTGYIDWVKDINPSGMLQYRVASINATNQLSAYSEIASATTRTFTDEELLNMVQQYTFRYFYDFAHPICGLARERNTSGDIVTTGGSGFGIMALLVGVNRGFITRQQAIQRLLTITAFLDTADRFHGVWPHWLNGKTGKVVPFSTYDDGGDLVETGFLAQGLLAAQQFFNGDHQQEIEIRNRITALYNSIEWDWYTRSGSGVLYWHWSPQYGWQMNMPIRGWNEAAIIYILAIASPTHGINPSLWNTGWAGGSNYLNGDTFYGYRLDVGWDWGGPLFFAQYSFQGFDPRNIKDQYTNYFNLNKNHTLINRAYCIDNPGNHPGYSENCWGLTASDDPFGYYVHEPYGSHENGTITPTAALSSMPYAPSESKQALKFFYRELGSKLWGRMGFYDAFNVREVWVADSYLAIDQGPIINMIENYRSALLWNNFMLNPEIAPALESMGFVPDPYGLEETKQYNRLLVSPNPTGKLVRVSFISAAHENVRVELYEYTGKRLPSSSGVHRAAPGLNSIDLDVSDLESGFYIISLTQGQKAPVTAKFIVIH